MVANVLRNGPTQFATIRCCIQPSSFCDKEEGITSVWCAAEVRWIHFLYSAWKDNNENRRGFLSFVLASFRHEKQIMLTHSMFLLL